MITMLIGENDFMVTRELQRLRDEFDGRAEIVDGAELEPEQLADLLMGQTLFAEKRLVILKQLSVNKSVWADFSQWLERLSEDITLVLVEPKPDKRTKTYKDLHSLATVREYKQWDDRDRRTVESWVADEAKQQGVSLSSTLVKKLIERAGSNQWRLFHALEKLAVCDDVTTEVIEQIVEPNVTENVFSLLEAALNGDSEKVHAMIRTLELTEDPFSVFGLLVSQVFQLATLAVSDVSPAEVAKAVGAHPFVLSKLSKSAVQRGRSGVKKIVTAFNEADADMKLSVAEPWLLIERALIKTATQ